jgi:hypothetical protein
VFEFAIKLQFWGVFSLVEVVLGLFLVDIGVLEFLVFDF